jgi:glycerophosphoryl diester phosphodiesterase
VRSHSFAALRELDAGSHFDIAFKGERIPELSEVFEAIGKRIVINIELKYSFDKPFILKGTSNSSAPINVLTGKVAQLILRHGLIGRVIISSFHPLILRRMRKILPEAACAFLTDQGKRGSIFRSRFGELIAPHQALHPDFHDVTPSLIHRVHETGRRLNAYTVNGTQDMKNLFSLGVDGIFTDDPLLAKKVLEAGSPIPSST